MNTHIFKLTTLALVLTTLGAALGYAWARHQALSTRPGTAVPPHTADRKPLYWYDPMVPTQHFTKAGKSPFMDMQLLPKYADVDTNGATGTVRIDPEQTQNLGMRVAAVRRGNLPNAIEAVGTLAYNDRDVAVIQARTGGFVQRVYGRAPGDVIPAGAPLADILVPDWAGAQREFLALVKMGDTALIDAGRERLRLLGMSAGLIKQVEHRRQVQISTTVTTPIGGAIRELDVRAGMTLMANQTLAKVNGLGTIWLDVAIPEAQSGRIQPGDRANIHLAAYPGLTRRGEVTAILPDANANSRTITARIELPNQDGRLRPGMYAQVTLAPKSEQSALLVPSEAIIQTGGRALVMVAESAGHYRPVEVQTAGEAGGLTAVRSGLTEGQRVVVSGQFLIDSEASLDGIVARADANTPAPAASYRGQGKVKAITSSRLSIRHGPIASLGWGAMTMSFSVSTPALIKGLKIGDRIDFTFAQQQGDFVVNMVHKTGSRP